MRLVPLLWQYAQPRYLLLASLAFVAFLLLSSYLGPSRSEGAVDPAALRREHSAKLERLRREQQELQRRLETAERAVVVANRAQRVRADRSMAQERSSLADQLVDLTAARDHLRSEVAALGRQRDVAASHSAPPATAAKAAAAVRQVGEGGQQPHRREDRELAQRGQKEEEEKGASPSPSSARRNGTRIITKTGEEVEEEAQ